MLLTTHYLDEAEALADRVGVIARGRLVEVAVPSSLGGRETAPAVVSWTEDGGAPDGGHRHADGVRAGAGRRGSPARCPSWPSPARPSRTCTCAMIGEPVMTTTTTRTDAVLPSFASVYRTRGSVELKEFFRQRESVVFTLAFPVILLAVFGAVLDYDIGGGVTFTQYFMAGIIAAGILGASLQNMAISIATSGPTGR